MTNPNRLVDQCVHKGLIYLAESLQYWTEYFEVAENNIALHLARSFAEKGFQVLAEIPFDGEKRRLDFLAYSYTENITVALEFKNSIETPQGNYEDLNRLVKIHNKGLRVHDLMDSEHKVYGIVTLLHSIEFADWWYEPKTYDYMPKGRSANDYKNIGRALEITPDRWVIPLVERLRAEPVGIQWRFLRAACALYDQNLISELGSVLGAS